MRPFSRVSIVGNPRGHATRGLRAYPVNPGDLVVANTGNQGSNGEQPRLYINQARDASGDWLGFLDFRNGGRAVILQDADAIYSLQALFQMGLSPPEPFPACGTDPTPAELGCEIFAACP